MTCVVFSVQVLKLLLENGMPSGTIDLEHAARSSWLEVYVWQPLSVLDGNCKWPARCECSS